ncbi:hypothetical protein PROFUN_05761 [Planoprotostelium fungivorum]|uniref:Uncharacterized protein n=1 Tax=Planoprotostelium fungivorum TaxID=1890364 RepID=A0A2P6NPV5_9EUKA|nr:hypothetical protein PROFUN_05761 [Planoprotostelium fungivorum]
MQLVKQNVIEECNNKTYTLHPETLVSQPGIVNCQFDYVSDKTSAQLNILWYRRNERFYIPLESLVSKDDCIMGSQTVQGKLLQHASLVINHKATAHQTELRSNRQNLTGCFSSVTTTQV